MRNPLPSELRWLFGQIRPELRLHTLSFLCLTVGSVFGIITPLSIRWLIDSVLPKRNLALLGLAIGSIFVSYGGRSVSVALGNYWTFRAAQRTALRLRVSLLEHVDRLSADHHERTAVGRSLYLFTEPIEEVCYFGSDLLPSVLRTIVATILALSAMTVLSHELTPVVIPLVPLFLVIRRHYRARIAREADRLQNERAQFSGFLEEHLSALVGIQLLRQVEAQEEKAVGLLRHTVSCEKALLKTGVLFSTFSNLTVATGVALVLGVGSSMVLGGRMTIGSLVAFYGLLAQLFDPLGTAMEMYARSQRIFAGIRQLRTAMALVPGVRNHAEARTLPVRGPLDIEFEDVRFSYAGQKNTLCVPRLRVLQAERIAVVGENGAGKSTLAKLLARVYDVESGCVRIAGIDVRLVRLDNLRSSVCYLSPRPVLFQRSLAENLRAGAPGATDEHLQKILEMVRLTEFVRTRPSGLDARVDPGASNLSGGERQRLAIARALLARPGILILDESTSALDGASEEAVLRSLDGWLPDSTLIVISHRLRSISWMKRILIMQNGTVIDDGSHSSLSAQSAVYRNLLWSQRLSS
jgi:ABC-type multidrug transport system fused ATPase/permease subunit